MTLCVHAPLPIFSILFLETDGLEFGVVSFGEGEWAACVLCLCFVLGISVVGDGEGGRSVRFGLSMLYDDRKDYV